MDLLQLRYFTRVAEQRSFSGAAVLLDVSQPTLSRAVRMLEVELNANLFRRTGRGVLLTPAGRRFVDHARGILRSAEAAREAVHEGGAKQPGRVVMGLPPSVGTVLIPLLVGRFTEAFREALVSFVQGLSDGLCEQVLTGRLDFAVVHNPAASSQLTIEPIANEELYLLGARSVGRRGDRVNLADIARLPLIMPNSPDATRPLIEAAMARRGLTPRIAYEIDSLPSIIEVVAQGYGYAIVPLATCLAVSPQLGLHIQRIDAPELTTSLCFVAPARPPKTALVADTGRMVREAVVEVLGRAPGTRRGPAFGGKRALQRSRSGS